VTETQDIVEALRPAGGGPQLSFLAESEEDEFLSVRQPTPPVPTDQELRTAIIGALGPTPVEIDDIVRFSGAAVGQVQMVLIELDLAGRIERHSGNRISMLA